MSEEQAAPENEPQKAQPATTPPATPSAVEEGKTFAILSYALAVIGVPFFLVPLIMRNNEFSLYHSKQCLLLWLVGVVGGTILAPTCLGAVLVTVFVWVLLFMGLANAVKALQTPVPLVGKWAEDWFKGLVVTK